jgi:hypothetical protein
MNAGEEKSARTNKASRQILDAELSQREKKTARLRALRLEKEDADRAALAAAPPKPAKKPARKKAASGAAKSKA